MQSEVLTVLCLQLVMLVCVYVFSYQREQLLAMLRLCDNADVFMNLFHQYHLDYGHPLPISAYLVLMRVCNPHCRLYFMMEILHVMIFKHKIEPPKEVGLSGWSMSSCILVVMVMRCMSLARYIFSSKFLQKLLRHTLSLQLLNGNQMRGR